MPRLLKTNFRNAMKKGSALLFICLFVLANTLPAQTKSFSVQIKNNTQIDRTDSYITIGLDKLKKKYPKFDISHFVIKCSDKTVPYQIESTDKKQVITFVVDIKAKSTLNLLFQYGKDAAAGNFSSRTYAELAKMKNGKFDGKRVHGTEYENINSVKVPSNHIDHDGLFKYEGPGWESERVGYRFYLDWRNATDIFGNKCGQLVLKNVGVKDTIADNNESFHTMQPWGMDIFKVGNSLGVGSFGMWDNGKVNMVSKTDSLFCAITQNGPVKSEIMTSYFGWPVNDKKFDVKSVLSILAGSRLTENKIEITGNPENLVTGLAKYPGTNLIKGRSKGEWNYLALYGHQSLADDNLGIVIFYKNKNLIELTEDNISHIVKLKPYNNKLNYFFGAAWEKELGGVKNQKEFEDYLEHTLVELNNPLIVELK